MLTADTITDQQIRELRRQVVNDPAFISMQTDDLCKLVGYALDDGKLSHQLIREARARCAEMLNLRSTICPNSTFGGHACTNYKPENRLIVLPLRAGRDYPAFNHRDPNVQQLPR